MFLRRINHWFVALINKILMKWRYFCESILIGLSLMHTNVSIDSNHRGKIRIKQNEKIRSGSISQLTPKFCPLTEEKNISRANELIRKRRTFDFHFLILKSLIYERFFLFFYKQIEASPCVDFLLFVLNILFFCVWHWKRRLIFFSFLTRTKDERWVLHRSSRRRKRNETIYRFQWIQPLNSIRHTMFLSRLETIENLTNHC